MADVTKPRLTLGFLKSFSKTKVLYLVRLEWWFSMAELTPEEIAVVKANRNNVRLLEEGQLTFYIGVLV
jgi:hypothetical protein